MVRAPTVAALLLLPLAALAAAPSWQDIEARMKDQRYAQALAGTEERLAEARARKDGPEVARALVTATQLRLGLQRHEEAVRFLREQPWPDGLLERTTLRLYLAAALTQYADRYAWEVNQREAVAGSDDVREWTAARIYQEASAQLARAWGDREALGAQKLDALGRYLEPNTYPAGLRDTLRDAVAYLWAGLLADSRGWSPEQGAAARALDLGRLLATAPRVDPRDAGAHPLERLSALLADLEAWHGKAGRREAALEAFLARGRLLAQEAGDDAQRAALSEALGRRLEKDRDLAWWAMGQADRAALERARDRLTHARDLARAGRDAYPKSTGGERCAALVAELEAPSYGVQAMAVDGPERRSIEVTHTNLSALYARAYALDAEALVHGRGLDVVSEDALVRLLAGAKPEASWRVALPATPDLRAHRTFVTPPLREHGMYAVVFSPREDFAPSGGPRQAALLQLSAWVLTARLEGPSADVRVLEGQTGRAVKGAEVRLVALDWGKGNREVAQRVADAAGRVALGDARKERGGGYLLVAGRGRSAVFMLSGVYLGAHGIPRPAPQARALLFTDRSAYRPGQTLRWKAVAFEAGEGEVPRRTTPGTPLTVVLRDAQGEEVARRTVRTNGFGTAAGELALPQGRPLGGWNLTVDGQGGVGFVVEEYKRPTLEVTLPAPENAPRLGKPATLRGEARYYFGLPVTAGQVRWRIERVPVFWGWGRGRIAPPGRRGEVVAAGQAKLDAEGRFAFTFTPQADESLLMQRPFVNYVFRAIADVTDEAGETRSGERTFKLGEVALEARIESEAGFLRAGRPAELTVKRLDLDEQPRAGAGRWHLTRLVPPARSQLPADLPVEEEPPRKRVEGEPQVTTEGDLLRPRWSTEQADLAGLMRRWKDGAEVGSGALTHDDHGVARVRLAALQPGSYRLHYVTQDPYGSTLEVSRELLVVGEGAPAPLAIALQFERTRAAVGSTVRLLAYSALEGQPLTLELRRPDGKVERREVRSGQPVVLDVPVTREMRGGLSARLSGVRDWQRLEQEQVLEVPFDDRELKVALSTFRDTLRPGAKETWRVTVRDAKGKPLPARAAEVLAYMYDRSLDLFAPHPAPPWAQLYAQRSRTEPLLMSLGAGPVNFLPGEPPPRPEWSPPREDGLRFLEGVAGLGTPRNLFLFEEGALEGRASGMADAVVRRAGVPAAAMAKRAAPQLSSAPPPPEGPAPVRTNFAETAFWLPHLLTDAKGGVTFEFTVPEAVTSWTVWAHALTRELAGGSVSQQVQTVKELMVRPYLPRFLREGDAAEVGVAVNNAGNQPLSGTVRIDLVDVRTGKSVLADFGVREVRQPFHVEAGKGTRVRFALTTPVRVGEVAFRAEAEAGGLRDGELRPLPILPGRLHLAQSRFVTLKDRDQKTLRFDELASGTDPGRVTDQLVVTVDAQLLYSVLAAMPYLVGYPYECTDVDVDRFATASILSQLYQREPALARMAKALGARATPLERFDQADPNRKVALEETPWLALAQGGKPGEGKVTNVLDPATARATADAALARLQAAQLPDGGFPWFRGGPASPFVTVSVLHGLARAAEFGAPVPEELATRAWRYVQGELTRTLLPELDKGSGSLELLTFLHYVASHPAMARASASALGPEQRRRLLDAGMARWQSFPPRLKAYLALTLQREGRAPDARRVFESIMDSARTSEALGTYWLPEERSWLWYNDTTESHATVLAALLELAPEDRRVPGLVQWLLLDKKLNHWKSPRATAEALFALVKQAGRDGLAREERVQVAVGPRVTDFSFSPDRYTGKGNQVVVPGAEVDPRTMSAVQVRKDTPGLAFASATWHFSTDALPKEAQGDFLSITRRYFRRERRGTEAVLVPLEQGTALRPGDELEVQLSIKAKHQAEYVLVRDPRPAGLEPGDVHSGYHFDLGLVRYEEVRDSGTNFFLEQVPVGEYTLGYRLRVATAGTFRAGPATLQPLYAPEFSAYSAGAQLRVEPAP